MNRFTDQLQAVTTNNYNTIADFHITNHSTLSLLSHVIVASDKTANVTHTCETQSFRTYQSLSYYRNLSPFKAFGKLITVLAGAHHWSVPWPRWVQCTPSSPNVHRYIILTDLSSNLFLSDFPTKILYTLLISST
jgi:hypothetical protein